MHIILICMSFMLLGLGILAAPDPTIPSTPACYLSENGNITEFKCKDIKPILKTLETVNE